MLTRKEKELLIRVLKREKTRIFGIKEDNQEVNALIEKLEQSTRNEKVNKVKHTKL